MQTVAARAAMRATDPLIPTTNQRRDVGAHGAMAEVACVDLCRSDIHPVRDDQSRQQYPSGSSPRTARTPRRTSWAARSAAGCPANSCCESTNCLAGAEQCCILGMKRTE